MAWWWKRKDEGRKVSRGRRRRYGRHDPEDQGPEQTVLKSVMEHRHGGQPRASLDLWVQQAQGVAFGAVAGARDAVERTVRAASATKPSEAIPFVASCTTSIFVHSAVVKGCQALSCTALRVSCATPIVSTVMGGAAVALGSVAAGSASRALQQPLSEPRGRARDRPFLARAWEAVVSESSAQDAALDAAVGLAFFVALGGRVRSVLPSDVRFPGANARSSMPAVGAAYATKFQRSELLRMLRTQGCHHCGRKSGAVIADHMPPNHFVERSKQARNGGLKWVLAKMRFSGSVQQRFYPQCRGCSQKQAVAVKKNRKVLVMHGGSWKPHHLAGSFVMFRTWSAANQGNVAANAAAAGDWVASQAQSLL